jgi:hypothetical protein
VNAPRRFAISLEGLAAFSIAVGLPASPGGQQAGSFSRWQSPIVFPASAADDGLVFSNDGAVVFLRNHFPEADRTHRFTLETDDCGVLASVGNSPAMLVDSALERSDQSAEDSDEDDPATEALTLVGRWLSTHPEIAVATDGVGKWCRDSWLDDEDTFTESMADLPTVEARPGRTWLRPKMYIA